MKRLLLIGLLSLLGFGGIANAQSRLEELEKRLDEAPVPAGKEAAREEIAKPAEPGFLGLTADDKRGGVEVIAVRGDGPAEQAGILPGDRLVSVAGVEIKSLDQMADVVSPLPVGARVEFVVTRGGRQRTITVVLGARPGSPADRLPREDLPREAPREEIETAYLGVRALPVDGELQRRFGLTVRSGAVIHEIERGSPADRFGLPLGAAIVAVDGARVDSPDDLAHSVAAARPGDTVEITYYRRNEVFRKKVRLAPLVAEVEPRDADDRPILRKLERALDSVIEPPPPRGDVRSLEAEVLRLRDRVEFLERRLEQLESRLGDKTPPRRDDAELEPPLRPLMP
jgi:S1-C subfamily serine protease